MIRNSKVSAALFLLLSGMVFEVLPIRAQDIVLQTNNLPASAQDIIVQTNNLPPADIAIIVLADMFSSEVHWKLNRDEFWPWLTMQMRESNANQALIDNLSNAEVVAIKGLLTSNGFEVRQMQGPDGTSRLNKNLELVWQIRPTVSGSDSLKFQIAIDVKGKSGGNITIKINHTFAIEPQKSEEGALLWKDYKWLTGIILPFLTAWFGYLIAVKLEKTKRKLAHAEEYDKQRPKIITLF